MRVDQAGIADLTGRKAEKHPRLACSFPLDWPFSVNLNVPRPQDPLPSSPLSSFSLRPRRALKPCNQTGLRAMITAETADRNVMVVHVIIPTTAGRNSRDTQTKSLTDASANSMPSAARCPCPKRSFRRPPRSANASAFPPVMTGRS